MSYSKLLKHRCDIYHLIDDAKDRGYGLPSKKAESYPDEPSLRDVKCYWSLSNTTVTQAEPNNVIVETYNVHFPINVDVRVNSKVNWEGVAYVLHNPRKVRNHHIEVIAVRDDSL